MGYGYEPIDDFVDAIAYLIQNEKLTSSEALAKFGLLDSARKYPSAGLAYAVSKGVPFDKASKLIEEMNKEEIYELPSAGSRPR